MEKWKRGAMGRMSFDFLLMGASGLFFLFVFMRVVKRGLGNSLAERKKAFEKRVRKTDAETREKTLTASSLEQMRPIGAAVREMLEMAGNPPGFSLLEEGKNVRLRCPEGEICIVFRLSTRPLSGTGGLSGPQGRWCITGPIEEKYTEHAELAGVVARLKAALTQESDGDVVDPEKISKDIL